jgi:hypothetical protein
MHYDKNNTFHLCTQAGYISTYTGYNDNAGAGDVGDSYEMDFEGVWNDFGQEVGNFLKIPKSFSVLASGTAGGLATFKWALDYSDSFNTILLPFTVNAPTKFDGVNVFGTATFAGTGAFERIKSSGTGSGQVIKLGLQVTVDGSAFALQRIDVLAKIGRLGL